MGGTILLADDSITIQKVVELTFAGTDSEVVAVGGGRELLARLPEVKPDVVLCDVVMPDMNGYDVCQAIKSDPATLHIPVVLLTGTFEPFDRERAVAAGCDSIVTKPFEARDLVALVDELLAKSAATRHQEAPMEPAAFGEAAVPALDFTTTGFDAMVPPPPVEPLPPAEGLEMTGGAAVEPVLTPPPTPRTNADTQPVTPPAEAARRQPSPDGEEEGAATAIAARATLAPADVQAAPFPAHDEGASVTAEAGPTAESGRDDAQLSEEDVTRIARRMLELSTPLLERIAWEVIPDMAEMIVRKRIRELESAVDEEN